MTPQHAITTLADIPRHHAATRPNSPALCFNEQSTDFATLNQRSNQVAHALRAEGLSAGENVAILSQNTDAFFPLIFGCAKAVIALVTVNFRLTAREIQYILSDSNAKLLFVTKDLLENIEGIAGELEALDRIVVIDDDGPQGLSTWLANQSTEQPAWTPPDAEDRAVQMYTSGTTGNPKGVELSHRAMIAAALEGLTVWPAMQTPDSAVLAIMPLFHIAAANLGLAGLFAGARVEIVREATPREIVTLIAERGIRVAPLPVPIIHAIVDLPDIADFDLSGFDTLLIAGSGIAVDLLQRAQAALNCGFALSYGMTECCGGVTYLGPDQCTPEAGERLKSAGRVLGACELKIVDENRTTLPHGAVGEIACRTNRIMNGYWGRPDATAEVVDAGWYYSGDAGYLDEDGFLYVVDRIKDMVVSGGENIYPAEIENELMRHPDIKELAVIGIPDEKWGEALLAFVVMEDGADLDSEALIAFCRDSLAGYKIPRRYQAIDALPRNATGKVLKRTLRDQAQALITATT